MTVLLVVLTVVIIISLDVLVVARRRRRGLGPSPVALRPMRPPQPPHNLFIDPAHGWVGLRADGTLRIGIDDFLAEATGSIDEITVPPVGTSIVRGGAFLTLRIGSRRLRVPAPVSGELAEVNHDALTNPHLVDLDPYGLGWVAAVWTRDHKEAIAPLHVGSGALAHLKAEFRRLMDLFTTSSSTASASVLADGGLPLRGALANLSDPAWETFQKQFLGARKEIH